MEQYSNRDIIINSIYNEFILEASQLEDDNPNKYAWLCGWVDKKNQYKRFEILTKIGVKKNDSILDIGCGVGELVKYLNIKKLAVNYVGIDINPSYIQIAKERFPDSTFLNSNGWEMVISDFDWALASGVFTLETNMTYILWYVGFVMERLVRKGFAFNLLHTAVDGLIAYKQDEVKRALEDRFPNYSIEIVDGYLTDDFTVYVKNGR